MSHYETMNIMDIGDIEAVMFTSHLLFGVSVCSGPNEYSMFLFLQVNVSNFESDLEPLMELFISIPHVHLRIKWICIYTIGFRSPLHTPTNRGDKAGRRVRKKHALGSQGDGKETRCLPSKSGHNIKPLHIKKHVSPMIWTKIFLLLERHGKAC